MSDYSMKTLRSILLASLVSVQSGLALADAKAEAQLECDTWAAEDGLQGEEKQSYITECMQDALAYLQDTSSDVYETGPQEQEQELDEEDLPNEDVMVNEFDGGE